MSSKTKIVVFKAKELIYTGIFIVLGILLICLLVYMFSPKDKDKEMESEPDSASSVISDGSQAKNSDEGMNLDVATETMLDNANTEATEDTDTPAEDTTENMNAETVAENGTTPESSEPKTQAAYEPGVYTTVMSIGGYDLAVTVTVDADRISHVDITNMDETVTAMYPLLPTVLDSINSQITGVNSIDEITYPEDQAYTTILICDAIKRALE